MASDSSILHHHITGAAEGVFHGHHPRLQAGRCRNCLKDRARFISIIDASIPPHLIQKILFLFFRHSGRIRSFWQGKRIIQVEFRDVHHSKDLSIIRLHHQYGHALRLFGCHDLIGQLCRILLDIYIHADIQILSVHGFHSVFPFFFHFNAPGIRHGKNGPRLPLQIFIIFHLQADDSLIVSPCKAKHLGSQAVKRIISLIVFIHLDSVQLVSADRISHLFIHIAFDLLNGRIFLHPFSYICFFQPQFLCKHLNHPIWLRYLVMNHGDRADRPVIRQHRPGRIQDPAPFRLNAPLPLVQFIRSLGIIGGTVYHQIHQPSREGSE